MQPRAVCFDFDSTLLDNSGFRATVRYTCTAIAAAHPPLDAAQLLAANTAVWDAYWPSIEQQWELGGITGAEVSLEGWRRTLRACGSDDASIALEAREIHQRHRSATVRLFPDALGTLEALTRAAIPLALITNAASDTQRSAFSRHGIERYFRAIVISGEHGVAKPDPAIFRIALHHLGIERDDTAGSCKRSDVWHVGDNPHTDVAGAKAAGLTAVWLNRERIPQRAGAPRADHEIHSLSDLTALLRIRDSQLPQHHRRH